jgi:tetratricopeptide (TPR) repeat protein
MRALLVGQHKRAMEFGSEACAVAKRVGAHEALSEALSMLALARVGRGDQGGVEDAKEAIEVAEGAGALVALSLAHNSLSSAHQTLGKLHAAYPARLAGAGIADRLGSTSLMRWFQGVLTDAHYRRGEWEEASRMADDFISDLEAGSPHNLAWQVYAIRGEIRLAKGDRAGAIGDVERALEAGRASTETGPLYFALAACAHVLEIASERVRAVALAREFLDQLSRGIPPMFSAINLPTFAAAARRLDLQQELIDTLAQHPATSWTEAVTAYAQSDFTGAVEILRRIGEKPAEAESRLCAAEQLAAAGRRADADEQVRCALDFYGSVGATAYAREGVRLLAATA